MCFNHRSPLNVVHGGLDLLMSEIREADPTAEFVPISRSTVELIQHIFSSSESAIDILNDLLQYEQIDAGSCIERPLNNNTLMCTVLVPTGIFKLEQSWRGLDGSFHNKLSWAQILADRSNVALSIEDSTLATASPYQGVEDIEQNGGVPVDQSFLPQRDTYLHIDVFRIDQVIRNMITNAVSISITISTTTTTTTITNTTTTTTTTTITNTTTTTTTTIYIYR